jgi:tRNA(fMet)-specific endonuclease VapC
MAARSYLLDTSVLSHLVRQPQGPVAARIADVGEDNVATSIAIRSALEKKGTPIGANDMLIAAQARALQAICVTANVAEFRRVPSLKVENWLE